MKYLVTASLITLTLAPAASAQDAETAAQQFIVKWVLSFDENNSKLISGFYEVDDRVEMLASNGLSLKGYEAIAESYRLDMKAVRFYDSKSRDLRVRVLGDTAIATFEHRFKYENRGDGTHRQIHVRTTSVLRMTKQGWRIAMEHSSAIRGIQREKLIREKT